MGSDYTITPDIVVTRGTVEDGAINSGGILVDDSVSRLASLRRKNAGSPLLHAGISAPTHERADFKDGEFLLLPKRRIAEFWFQQGSLEGLPKSCCDAIGREARRRAIGYLPAANAAGS